ncbi:protein SIEVE ELEMENT OCCLUSION B-like [Durio zibethinus]|uniref:Protein SIEVE ELEMENT OCCLUSION B-like n=1 Tax=Durio zibethinus TaxID=66656 RepID=A0A6P5YL28_DURZI|nr:protein SIEVE ELEMENT OCCLUSION B-like [Durio zibethinus]
MESMLTPTAKMQQPVRGERLMISMSNDSVMLKQIQSVHAPDGRVIDVRPLLHIVEDIFNCADSSSNAVDAPGMQAHTEAFEDQTYKTNVTDMLDAFLIDRISCEMAFKCTETGEAHAATMSILNMVSYYSWDAKLVIALSAFAVNYGEFWLLAQSYSSNQLAKNLAILRQVPEIIRHLNMLKSQLDTIKNLIRAMLDIAKCIVDFKELPSKYITADVTAMSKAMDLIPIAIYWTIRSILASASQITGLSGFGNEYLLSTTESWELSSLVHKLSNMHSHLVGLLATCYKHIDERKFIEAYQNLLYLFETAQIDNNKVLKALINPKDDPLPLVDGATKKRVNVDVLRKRNVLLLISDVDILQDEVVILEQIYNESESQPTRLENQYEFVWLPVLDPSVPLSKIKQDKFENLNGIMTWYTLHHPSMLDGAVFKFIKEVWHFEKKPILVVLDPQGRVACPNALHMMWIWGALAFPFTTAKEDTLWKAETWKLELLVDGIDPVILNWISDGRFIFLYGGEDIEWIRKFTNTVHDVARASGLALEMVYVGKSYPKERVQRNMATITAEKLSYCLPNLTAIWYFWIRIESMWYSKHQLSKADDNDPITQEIETLLSFDSSEGGWALLSKGSSELTRAKGSAFLTCLSNYNLWAEDVQTKGLVLAIHDYFLQHPAPHHCNRLVLPGTARGIPERVICSECGRTMERYILYQCCDE